MRRVSFFLETVNLLNGPLLVFRSAQLNLQSPKVGDIVCVQLRLNGPLGRALNCQFMLRWTSKLSVPGLLEGRYLSLMHIPSVYISASLPFFLWPWFWVKTTNLDASSSSSCSRHLKRFLCLVIFSW